MKRIRWNMGKGMILCGFLLLLMCGLSYAQEFPTKPINMVITFSPGGSADPSMRLLASKAEKFLGQPFVTTNNGGGGGSVAMTILSKERPDGYHISGCSSTSLIRIPQFREVPYKHEDFVPIMHFGAPPSGLVVKADSPWKTLKEFVEYAKKNPGKVTYSSMGIGSPMHLAMEFIAKQEGIQWTHVPYPGSGPAFTAVLGGHVTAQSGSSESYPHVRAGTIRLLAIHHEKRFKSFPDVPTFREMGYDFINESVFMFAGPKGIPPSIVKRLDEAFRKGMEDPEFIQTMEKMEIVVSYRNSEDLKKYLEEAYDRLGKMIRELKLPKEPEKK
ncbi:MAG: tripartite tricarboxylate transporter substrate binding protein [Deltaproteobacteria bacterium]|nr:tripartite tricarboxylate transporter substrate binding protein [Deltaproteobacteria bacterium]